MKSQATAFAPGRVTVIGEHVDYVGGKVAACAIGRGISITVAASADGLWRIRSGDKCVERAAPSMQSDVGDRVFAAVQVLNRKFGMSFPPLDFLAESDLPISSGLSSSAAVTVAAIAAMLRLHDSELSARDLADAAYEAEHDIVGIPCGRLDQRTVAESRSGEVSCFDFFSGERAAFSWPWSGADLVVVSSRSTHDVGGDEYSSRRAAAEAALSQLGVENCQQIGERWRECDAKIIPYARHIATETRRTDQMCEVLKSGDLVTAGRLLNESHASLRDDYRVSTPLLDAMVEAANEVTGCHGARIVGAGFGGSAIAMCDSAAAQETAAAMARVAQVGDAEIWIGKPAPGTAELTPDAIRAG